MFRPLDPTDLSTTNVTTVEYQKCAGYRNNEPHILARILQLACDGSDYSQAALKYLASIFPKYKRWCTVEFNSQLESACKTLMALFKARHMGKPNNRDKINRNVHNFLMRLRVRHLTSRHSEDGRVYFVNTPGILRALTSMPAHEANFVLEAVLV